MSKAKLVDGFEKFLNQCALKHEHESLSGVSARSSTKYADTRIKWFKEEILKRMGVKRR
jgi:hypothetical protein